MSLFHKYLYLFITILVINSTIAQVTFERTYGGKGNEGASSVQQTSDGGYIIAGTVKGINAGPYDYNVLVVKTDSLGDTLWTKTYGGEDMDCGTEVQQTSDDGYIIAGYTRSFGIGGLDVYLLKLNSSGDTLWTRTYGGTEEDAGFSVQQTSDGGYIIAGSTYSFGVGVSDFYLLKTDSSGVMLWTRTYGGFCFDEGFSVQQTSDGGYIITGETCSFGNGNDDVYLVKTNSLGDTLWTRTYGGTYKDWGISVQQTSDDGYIVAGWTWPSGTAYADAYLIKTNSRGDTLWIKTYGGSGYDDASSVRQTLEGGYIIAGSTSSFGPLPEDVYLIKADHRGDTLWTRTFGGIDVDIGAAVRQTSDGGYIVAGVTYNSSGLGDVYLIKTNANGIVSVRELNDGNIPTSFRLDQNYPNPFNPSTKIKYSIPRSSQVVIEIFDIIGNEIEKLVNEEKTAGTYELTWYAEGLPSGVYFYQLKAGDFIQTKKMVLMK